MPNGRPFDIYSGTFAHRDLPLEIRVQTTNHATGNNESSI